MSEQILSCADMCPNTFQSLFHALQLVMLLILVVCYRAAQCRGIT